MTAKTQDYMTRAAGWVAGKYYPKGAKVALTGAQARSETVMLASDAGPDVELVGSLDDPTVKSSGLADAAAKETAKRSRAKK